MEKLGIIGQGFVGTAVREGMKNHYDLVTYDKDPEKRNVKTIYELVLHWVMLLLKSPNHI